MNKKPKMLIDSILWHYYTYFWTSCFIFISFFSITSFDWQQKIIIHPMATRHIKFVSCSSVCSVWYKCELEGMRKVVFINKRTKNTNCSTLRCHSIDRDFFRCKQRLRSFNLTMHGINRMKNKNVYKVEYSSVIWK